MAKVIGIGGITQLDLPPDKILENNKGELTGVLLLGWDHDARPYFASSISDRFELIYLLEKCKQRLLTEDE